MLGQIHQSDAGRTFNTPVTIHQCPVRSGGEIQRAFVKNLDWALNTCEVSAGQEA